MGATTQNLASATPTNGAKERERCSEPFRGTATTGAGAVLAPVADAIFITKRRACANRDTRSTLRVYTPAGNVLAVGFAPPPHTRHH